MIYVMLLASLFSAKIPHSKTNISWYATGNITACGEAFSPYKESLASNFLPIGTVVRFYPEGQEPFVLTVNDFGPYAVDSEGYAVYPLRPHPTRGFDFSLQAYKMYLGNLDEGIARNVGYEVLGRKIRRTMKYNLERYAVGGSVNW